jgi:hypothetical protein
MTQITNPSPQALTALRSLERASLEAIRQAAIHGTNMVVRLNGVMQTIKPEQHPLYTQAMPQGLRTAA